MTNNEEKKSTYESEYRKEYEADWDVHRNYINTFDAYEAMVLSQVYDSVTGSIDNSKVTDGYATTLAKERADRVMAKLPEGDTMCIGKSDAGKAAFMDILRQKWVYPNANAQHPLLEKFNMWQFYSSVYGYMVMFYDWNVSPSGYAGPDCWLVSPRNFVPEVGKVSINDMDHATALVWVANSRIDALLDSEDEDGGWNKDALRELKSLAKQTTTGDAVQDTGVQRDRTPSATRKGICLATRYEAGEDGEWVTFAPDHGYCEVRRIKNPHKNGRIPFVVKYSQPLFDSFYGLGDFQRAKPLQFARDGLRNFYFKGVKMNLIPPIVANAFGVQKHTLDYREGAVMLETMPNSIRRLETSTAGLATYQAAMSDLTGSLLSQFGTQNASLPGADALNPSQGKTPQAINMYSDKEATRDGAEVRHLETAIEQLVDGFNSLIVNIGTEDIPVNLLAEDIQAIKDAGYSDVQELFKDLKESPDGSGGELRIKAESLKGVEYRFSVTPDSTAKINKQAQLTAVENAMDRIGKMQNVFQDDPGLNVEWQQLMAMWGSLTDLPGAAKLITYDPRLKKEQMAREAQLEQQKAQSQTAVNMPGGEVHESADLVKLFLGTTNVDLQNQILSALGFQPVATEADNAEAETPEPEVARTIAGAGHQFDDPEVGASAQALHDHFAQPLPDAVETEAPEPHVSKSGLMFGDPHVGQAADAISNM